MPVRKFDNADFLYIIYNREKISDIERLREEMALEASQENLGRDTIVDLSRAEMISSVEISILVKFLKMLPGTGRFLRLVVSKYLREILTNINLHRIPNLILYDNLESLQNSLCSQFVSDLASETNPARRCG